MTHPQFWLLLAAVYVAPNIDRNVRTILAAACLVVASVIGIATRQ